MATEQFKNLSVTALAEDIDGSVTSFDVADASVLSSAGQFRINIEDELMLVTGVSTNTLTVTRGIEGTSTASHTNGDTVSQVLTAGAIDKRTEDDCLSDTYANRPAAGRAGRLYLPSDDNVIYRDTGSSWRVCGFQPAPFAVSTPLASSFTSVNNTDATLVDRMGGLRISAPTNSLNANKIQLFVRSLPTPPCTITAVFRFNFCTPLSQNDSPFIGLCFWNSSGTITYNLYVQFTAQGGGGQVRVTRFAAYTGTASNLVGSTTSQGWHPHISAFTPVWLRLADDNTNRQAWVSFDGFTWNLIHEESRTANSLTADRVGLCLNMHRSQLTDLADGFADIYSYIEA